MPLFYDHPMIQTCFFFNHIKPHQTTITPLNSIEISCFSHQTNLRKKKQVAGNSMAASTLPVVVPSAGHEAGNGACNSVTSKNVGLIYIYIKTHTHTHIYIYIPHTYIYIHIYIYIFSLYLNLYLYLYDHTVDGCEILRRLGWLTPVETL